MVASKNEFLTKAKPFVADINGTPFGATPKLFATGSCGWYVGGKMTVQLGEHMQVLSVTLDGQPLAAVPKNFSTGNIGWYATGKINFRLSDGTLERTQVGCNLIIVGSKAAGGVTQNSLVPVQVSINMIVVGSKELPMDAVPDTEVAPTTPSHPAPGKKQKKQVA